MDTTWLSAYLFWPGSLDELLVRCVAPLVQYGLQRGWASSFFFIRYAEGGPHIRLRLKATSAAARAQLAALVTQRFAQFRRAVAPSINVATNRVQFVAYEPEIDRYGGPLGLPVAETFFEASSRVVLRWLRTQAGAPTPASRLTVALSLHARQAAACYPPAPAAAWLRHYTATWLPHDPAAVQSAADEARYWLRLFAERYIPQRAALRTLVAACWPPPVQAGRHWLGAYAAAARRLPADYAAAGVDPASCQQIYASLLHMTNNRLGVPNHDEAFVTYLLGEAVQELADSHF